jgi:hypothetical protein
MSQNAMVCTRKTVETSIDDNIKQQNKSGVLVRLPAKRKISTRLEQEAGEQHADCKTSGENYRDAVCGLCEHVVSMALNVSLREMRSSSRCKADIAMARQIAMYLAHTKFSILMTEVGLHFCRDRTTVSYACAQIEDRRDEFSFDLMICQLEALLGEALEAISHSRSLNGSDEVEAEKADTRNTSLLAQLSFLEKGKSK